MPGVSDSMLPLAFWSVTVTDMTFVSSPSIAQLMLELHNPLQDLDGSPLTPWSKHAHRVDTRPVVEMLPERKPVGVPTAQKSSPCTSKSRTRSSLLYFMGAILTSSRPYLQAFCPTKSLKASMQVSSFIARRRRHTCFGSRDTRSRLHVDRLWDGGVEQGH